MPSSCGDALDTLAVRGVMVYAGDVARDLDVAFGGQRGQQVEFLKDEADFRAPQAGAVGVGQLGEVDAVDDDAAGVGVREPAENVEQGRLAAARRADDGDELTLLDFERYASQGRHIDFADAIGLAHVLSLNHPPHANLRYYTILPSGHSAGVLGPESVESCHPEQAPLRSEGSGRAIRADARKHASIFKLTQDRYSQQAAIRATTL